MNRYLLFVGQLYDFPILRPLQAAIRDRGDQAAWYLHGIDKSNLRADEEHLPTVPEVKTYNPVAVYVPTRASIVHKDSFRSVIHTLLGSLI